VNLPAEFSKVHDGVQDGYSQLHSARGAVNLVGF